MLPVSRMQGWKLCMPTPMFVARPRDAGRCPALAYLSPLWKELQNRTIIKEPLRGAICQRWATPIAKPAAQIQMYGPLPVSGRRNALRLYILLYR